MANFSINTAALKDGDIILIGRDAFVSRTIKKLTKSNFSHAIMYANGVGIEAKKSAGVHPCNVSRLKISFEKDVKVLRLKNGLDTSQASKVSNIAHAISGTKYSFLATSLTKIKLLNKSDRFIKLMYCSKFIARCYQLADIPLALDGIDISPEELNQCNSFYELPQREYLMEHIGDFLNQGDDLTEIMGERLLKVCMQMEKEFGSENLKLHEIDPNDSKLPLNRIEDFVSNNPQYGTKVNQIINSNKYFDGPKFR